MKLFLCGDRLAWWETIRAIAVWGIKMKMLHGIFSNQYFSSNKHKDQRVLRVGQRNGSVQKTELREEITNKHTKILHPPIKRSDRGQQNQRKNECLG